MSNSTTKTWGLEGEELPEVIKLRSGSVICPRDNHWKFVDGVRAIYINFSRLPAQVEPLKDNLKRVLINVLEENSPQYASNMFYNFCRLADVIAESGTTEISEVQAMHILNFIAKYPTGDSLGMESQLSSVIARWNSLSLKGFSSEASALLTSRRKKGNIKGESVRTLDPVHGPLTDFELQEFTSVLDDAYAGDLLDEQLYLLAWLVVLTGQRVSQYCMLKVMDLKQSSHNGDVRFEIDIPKAKQRAEVPRDSFLRKPLPQQFGASLWAYAVKVRAAHFELGEDAPLFPCDNGRIDAMQLNEKFKGHWEAVVLAQKFTDELTKIAPVSPRTSEPMNIVVGRFRDTIGTRAAQEGYGELVIAEILGHSDTQNVGAYVAVIPEIAPRLDKQLAKDLAHLANAFTGKVLRNDADATRADDVTSQIVDYRHAKAGVGRCGTMYDCQFNAPMACYTCRNFEAWIDAPHEKLLTHLLAERERLLVLSGPRIAAINDRTIVAIQAVVDECERIKNDGENLIG